jgi:cell division septum initiation protein DivIVA
MLDKQILVEYADMKEEIKDLRRRIQADQRELDKLNQMIVVDSVTCGKKGKKPLGTVKVEGKPKRAIARKQSAYERKIARLEELEADLLEKQIEVEEYIEQIEKSRLRIMFRLYYIDNLTWEMVAMKMNYMFPKKKIAFTKDSCRMAHDRFLEKVL